MTGIAIARALPQDCFLDALEAAYEGGFRFLEITMNSPQAAIQIRESSLCFAGRAMIGAGTVTTLKELDIAVQSGAQFIVCPNTNIKIIVECVKSDLPVYPGALTPTEIFSAFQAGASMVKVFPASSLGGPSYFRELKGPFSNIPLLACGGVNTHNIRQYLEAGAAGFACGGSLFSPLRIEQKDWKSLTKSATDLFSLIK